MFLQNLEKSDKNEVDRKNCQYRLKTQILISFLSICVTPKDLVNYFKITYMNNNFKILVLK